MTLSKQWGIVTWIFLHGLAEKLNENKFSEYKNLIILIIKDVCKNLPCPDCRNHAINLINNSNIKKINSKNDIRSFLWEFHNIINLKLKKPKFDFNNLNEYYKNLNLNNVIISFFKIYSNLPYNEKLMMDSFQRGLFLKNLKINLNNIKKYLIY